MDLLALVSAFALVFLNGFFVAAEFAIVKVRPTRIEELIRTGRRGALAVPGILRNLDGYLSVTQLGITLASIGLGMLGEPAFARLLAGPLDAMGVTDPELVHRIALGFAFFTMTLLHVVLGELAPKSMAILRSEDVAITTAWPMRIFYVIFFPLTWALNGMANLVLRLFGLHAAGHGPESHTEEEIRIILSQARSAGLLKPQRADILQKALSLPTKTARHIMVPRNEVVYLDVTQSLEENMARAEASSHTRFPLGRQGLDDILGIVDVRTVLFWQRSHPGEDPDLTDLCEPCAYLPETMSAERLLTEFRTHSNQMAVVVDEYGGTAGIVTAADVVTTVMGELQDEEESDLIELPGGVYDVEGTTSLEEIRDVLHVEIQSDDMRTVAGFLMERLGRMPQVRDRVSASGYTFIVLDVQGPRVRRVRIQKEHARSPTRVLDSPTRREVDAPTGPIAFTPPSDADPL